MHRRAATKWADKLAKTIRQQAGSRSPEPLSKSNRRKANFLSNDDRIVPSLKKPELTDHYMKVEDFKMRQKEFKMKKYPIIFAGIGLFGPSATVIIAYQNLKNNVREKDKEAQVNKLKTQVNELKAQANELKAQANELKTQTKVLEVQHLEFQTDLNRLQKQEEKRQKQSKNSLYNRVFGSGGREG